MPNLINRNPDDMTYCKVIQQRSHTGTPIKLMMIHHDDDLCKEYVVFSPEFSIKKWLLLTVIFNIIGFSVNLHLQDERIMSWLIVILVVALLVKMRYKVKKESLLVMKSIGVQHTTTFALGREECCFYDMQQINDIIINEGVTMWKVIFYLSLLLQDSSTKKITQLIPLFTQSWPSLSCVQMVYRGATSILFNRPVLSPRKKKEPPKTL